MMKQKAITLEQLIPYPESLRLLILHTPEPINMQRLVFCHNLLKLDLSSNNIQAIPFLGHLQNLGFLFLHNNKLGAQNLEAVFEDDVQFRIENKGKSALAKKIAWVTYWGNRNTFSARHYLVNNTNVIAVDKYLVVEEQRSQNIYPSFQAYSQVTQLPFPIIPLPVPSINSSTGFNQDDYINYFHNQLSELRRRALKVNPVVRIQALWRGYRVRNDVYLRKQKQLEKLDRMKKIIGKWRDLAQNKKRLREIMRQRGKQYLLETGKIMRKMLFMKKLRQLAQQARQRVQVKKEKLKMEIRIAKSFSRNFQTMQHLYSYLELNTKHKIYIKKQDFNYYRNKIFPIVQNLNKDCGIRINESKIALLKTNIKNNSRIPFMNIVLPATQATIIPAKQEHYKVRKTDNSIPLKILRRLSLSNKQVKQSIDLAQKSSRKFEDSQNSKILIQFIGTPRQLKDFVRAVYYNNISAPHKLQIFPEKIVDKLLNVIRIQRIWRGYKVRKTIKYKQQVVLLRAATRIQRWFRKLPGFHRQKFMLSACHFLKSAQNRFFLKLKDYLDLTDISNRRRLKFLQQNIEMIYQKNSKSISLHWQDSATTRTVSKFIAENERVKKPLFSKRYQRDSLGFELDQMKADVLCGDCYHLIHFNTRIKRVKIADEQYIVVDCLTKKDTKIRLLGLKLLTYSFNRGKNIDILTKLEFSRGQTPQTQVIQTLEPYHLFLYVAGQPVPKSQQIQAIQIVRSVDLTIYLKQNKNAHPFKVSEKISYLLCVPSYKVQQKQDYLRKIFKNQQYFSRRKSNGPKNLHIKELSYGLNQSCNVGKTDSKIYLPAKRYQLEQLSKKSIAIDIWEGKSKPQQSITKLQQKSNNSLNQMQPSRKPIKTMIKQSRHQRFLTQPNSIQSPKLLNISVSQCSPASVPSTRLLQQYQPCLPPNSPSSFLSNFINTTNFLAKQQQKTELRNRHCRLLSQITQIAHKNKVQQSKAVEAVRMCRNQRIQLAKSVHNQYKIQLEQTRRLVELDRRAKKKGLGQRKSMGKMQRRMRLVFPEEIYPVEMAATDKSK